MDILCAEEDSADDVVAVVEPDAGGESDNDRPPYTTAFLVEYCRKHWSSWVNKVHHTLVEMQQEIDALPMPTRRLSTASRGLELMLPPMMMVRSVSFDCWWGEIAFRSRRTFNEAISKILSRFPML